MSDDQESSGSAIERARKAKAKAINDDDTNEQDQKRQKLSVENFVTFDAGLDEELGDFKDQLKQQQESLIQYGRQQDPFLNPLGVEEAMSIDDFCKDQSVKEQEPAPLLNLDQNPEIAGSSRETATHSDAKKDNMELSQQLIFERRIFDVNHLSVPYEMVSEYVPTILEYPNREMNLYLIDHTGKKWQVGLIYDSNVDTHKITSGLNAYIKHNQLKRRDFLRISLPIPQESPDCFRINHQKSGRQFLFEVPVTRSNKLRIPRDLTENHFEPRPNAPQHLDEFFLRIISYPDKKRWHMTYVDFDEENSYIIVQGWERYVAHHGLNHKDKIRFFDDYFPDSTNSFTVLHEEIVRPPNEDIVLADNSKVIFASCLTEDDVFRRVQLRGFKPPSDDWRESEMVKLTDCNNTNWYVEINYNTSLGVYVISDGWKDIVKEHNLEAGVSMRISMPVNGGDHRKHFVIQFGINT